MRNTDGIEVRPPQGLEDARRFAAILSESLRFPRLEQTDWLDRYELGDMRLCWRRGELAAGLMIIPMGQWFGGRVVPMVGISAVGVAPEHRGHGVGGHLVRTVVRELHERGEPLSGLYPATQPVYRRAGYELAGSYTRYRIPTAELAWVERAPELEITRATDEEKARTEAGDKTELAQVYARFAERESGLLVRRSWGWWRMFRALPSGEPSYTFIARRDGVAEGYITFIQRPDAGGAHFYDLECRELVALTPGAWRRLLGLVADHRSMAPSLLGSFSPVSPLGWLMREQAMVPTWRLCWMTRIVRVAEALESRGYASGVRAAVRLRVHDDVLPDNSGTYCLEVEDGRAQVSREGQGTAADIELDIRGLAPLYTGYASAATLATAGLVAGDGPALARASALFAGPPPWLPETY